MRKIGLAFLVCLAAACTGVPLAPHVDSRDAGRSVHDALSKAPPKPKDPGRLPPDWPCWPCN